MSLLVGKRVLIGIGGSIAAYKIPDLVRRLRDLGAEVRVVMSHAARAFITPLTLQAVSGHSVACDLLDPAAEAAMGHIQLAKWADLIVIAPATADVIARLAAGIADDLLTTLCLAASAPIAVAPAMNQQMYTAAVTQNNLARLVSYQMQIWGPAVGLQACGDQGPGCLLEPSLLLQQVVQHFSSQRDLQGMRWLVTAGPTQELLDPVRFISNRSSGKMGFCIAQAAAARGANVTLITGPVVASTPPGVERLDVVSALEMYEAVMQVAQQHDIFVACAAVADYRPQQIFSQKIKKQAQTVSITLIENPDIVAQVSALRENRPYVVGFAAETEHLERHARGKLLRKQVDLMCANDVSKANHGFDSATNALHLYWRGGDKCLPLTHKMQLAQQLIDEIIGHYNERD